MFNLRASDCTSAPKSHVGTWHVSSHAQTVEECWYPLAALGTKPYHERDSGSLNLADDWRNEQKRELKHYKGKSGAMWHHMTLGTGGFPGIDMVGWGGGGVGWGMITFFALAHMVGATQHHGMGWGGVGDDNVPCTCTHGRCYATSSFLCLHTWSLLRNIMGWGGVGWGGGW